MGTWVTLGTALVLGFLHALEVDHMLAVTAFVSRRPALATAAGFGARWGIGHSISVCLAGGLLLVAGVRWPERYDSIGEVVVGILLVGLGAWALRSASKLHLHIAAEHGDHAHLHHHGHPAAGHAHAHGEGAGHSHDHRHGITWVGMLHGLAGTAGVVALVPVTLIASRIVGFGYLVAFGVGVTAGMTLFAFVAAAAMRAAATRSLAWGRAIASVVGLAGITVGVWWIWRAADVLLT